MKRVGQVWLAQRSRRWLILEDRTPEITAWGWHMNYLALDLDTGLAIPITEQPKGWEGDPRWERIL